MRWSTKLRVVIDTNVFISGLIWGGNPKKVLEAWLLQKFDLLISPYLCVEIIDVYQRFNRCELKTPVRCGHVFNSFRMLSTKERRKVYGMYWIGIGC